MNRRPPATRAVVVGAILLLVAALAVVALDRSDEGEDTFGDRKPRPAVTFVLDADRHGAVFQRGLLMTGVTSEGRVRWKLRLTEQEQLPFAVCLRTCPQAEIGRARDGAEIPAMSDAPRLRVGPPAWRPQEVGPRLPVDRPILPGPSPARLIIARPGDRPSVKLAAGASLKLRDTVAPSYLAPSRHRALVLAVTQGRRQRASVLQRIEAGWTLRSQRRVTPAALAGCMSADGSRIGLIGGGEPRVADVNGGRIGAPARLRGARPAERNAGSCAIGRDTVATAVQGANVPGVVSVHVGQRLHTLRVSGVPQIWVSARTGATAVQLDDRIVLIGVDGRRRSWRGVDGATADGSARLRLFTRSGKASSRAF